MMKIGVISDTHGYFDPKIATYFSDVEHIIHGGDIGRPEIIVQLEQLAPVTAVLGNNDAGLDFRETEMIRLADRNFLVHHIVDPREPTGTIHRRIRNDKPDVIVFGHTHKIHNEVREGILFFNPGYAGKPRFNLPRSIAVLYCDPGDIRAEFHCL